ncbi:MAG: hypothetical protein ACNA8W_08500 [Bradymonadaceae bacterium]
MNQTWYLIDDDGCHAINIAGTDPLDFWSKFNRKASDQGWPPFSQLAVDAGAERTRGAILEVAEEFDLALEEITDQPEAWAEAIFLAHGSRTAFVAEPSTELDEQIIGQEWASAIVQRLCCAGAFFGYDPAGGTLHLTMFDKGRITFSWCDSLSPGPSYALVFHADGTCTHEDPRHFALRMMDMPPTSPLLDRHAFLETNLRLLGIDAIHPDLEPFPIHSVMRILRVA